MAVTTTQNVIIPEVMGDMINAKIEAQLKLSRYAKVDTSLQGVPGDTKSVPAWNYIGDAVNQEENTLIDYTQMSASVETFTVKKAAKGVTITTEAIISGLGNPVGQAESQLAKAINGKVDTDVVDAALGAPMVYDGTASVINYNGIVDAVTRFEDEEDGIDKVMFIHPAQEATLLKDDDFLSADKFIGGVAVNGAIGKIAGCWIKKSKKAKKVDAVTAVQGVYTIKIDTKAAVGDRIKIGDVEYIAGVDIDLTTDTATGNATAIAALLNASEDASVSGYTWAASSTTITATEDTDYYGIGVPSVTVTKYTGGTLAVTVGTTTEGVAGVVAHYENPIIKLEADSADTEYTEDELPAITIFLKKDTTVNTFYNQDYDRHEITAYKYYGVALTNGAKVVVAKFGVA